MIINTLGPTATDCFYAINRIKLKVDVIVLYDSFDSIVNCFDKLKGQYILLPVAFESSIKNYSWKDFNFEYHKRIEIVDSFHSFTKGMVLIENCNYKINRAIIQPATEILMLNYLKKKSMDLRIDFTHSKVMANKKFLEEGYRFSIVSQETIINNDDIIICETFFPEMIWCLYRVKG